MQCRKRTETWRGVGVLLGLTLVAWLALPAGSLAAGSGAAAITPYARTLLAQINQFRQDSGLQPLVADPTLTRAARTHSFMMFQQKRLSHLRFEERFKRSSSRLCVENIGRGQSNPLRQFDGWRRSGAHEQNMLVEDIRRAGIAEVGGFVTFFACQ